MPDLLETVAAAVAYSGQAPSAGAWFAGSERVGYEGRPGHGSDAVHLERSGFEDEPSGCPGGAALLASRIRMRISSRGQHTG
jgi:hypothetical protein